MSIRHLGGDTSLHGASVCLCPSMAQASACALYCKVLEQVRHTSGRLRQSENGISSRQLSGYLPRNDEAVLRAL